MSEIIKYQYDLPSGWALIKFNECCDNISLNGIKIKQKQYQQSGKFPVVDQGQDLIGGYFDDEKLVVPSEPPYVIFGDHTKIKKFVKFKFIAGADGVKVLKPYDFYNPKLLYYFIHGIKIPDRGYARHFQFLANADFPLPPLPEQHRIVKKIEELFTDLDKGIENLKTAQQQLKVYRQAVLQWAFEGKLTNKKINDGELPKDWKQVPLESVSKAFGGYAFKSTSFKKSGSHQVLRIGNVRPGIVRTLESPVFIDATEQEIKKAKLEIDDVIITLTGTKGKRDYGFTTLIKQNNFLLIKD